MCKADKARALDVVGECVNRIGTQFASAPFANQPVTAPADEIKP